MFGRDRQERELDAELTYHIDMLTEQNVQRGMTRAQARREALRVFGSVAAVKDDVRDTWVSRFVEIAVQDVRYGIRSLRRNPGFAFVIVLTMALGIGANTAIFSVVNGVLLRPLPYKDGDKLVELHHGAGDAVQNDLNFSPKDIADYRLSPSISDVVEFHNMLFTLLGRAEPLRVSTAVVSPNYFDVLGIKPIYGRTFVAADDAPGAPAVLVLTHAYWVNHFDEDPNVVGRVFRMNDKPHTVVGVLPDIPLYNPQGSNVQGDIDVFMPSSACPFRARPQVIEGRSQGRMLSAFARVRPEATLSKSAADIAITAARLQKDYPQDYPEKDFRAVEIPVKDEMTANFKPTLWILLGTAAFVLLIVCASIANLLLARLVRRDRELSLRAALGASRARILRQLLTESVLLALAGGLVGLALSSFALKLLVTFAERFTPRAHEISIDPTVLAFTFGLSVLTGLVFGSIPGLSRRIDVAQALRDGGRTSQSSQGVRNALIVAQIGASFMLLIAAGLLLRSLIKIQNVNPGFHTEHVLTFRADMAFDRFPPGPGLPPKVAAYWSAFEQRIAALPGVTSVGGGSTFPLNEQNPFNGTIEREAHVLPPGVQPPKVSVRIASADYFRTLGQPLIAGRVFTASDTTTSPTVVIVSESAARQAWGTENPIGTRIKFANNGLATVVGIVADIRQQLDRDTAPEVYVPIQQAPRTGISWLVQTALPPDRAERAIRDIAQSLDSTLPLTNFRTLAEVRAAGLAPRRVVVALIGLFGLLALVITATGIAGVIAFSVNQRTQEFGIRMALGAQRNSVLGLVVRDGLLLVSIGLAIGVAGALVLTKLLGQFLVSSQAANGALLVDVPPTDALTYTGVAAVLVLVAVAACLMPARRAASVDPMIALRAQ